MLRVTLLGNLGADPEVRFTQKGTQLVSFNVAVNQVRTGPDGERQENTEWFRIRVANRQTEYAQRFTKGTRVLVIGRLDIGHYQSKQGEPRTSFDVWAEEVQSVSMRGLGSEPDSMPEGEAETREPALAGVSSLASPATGRTSTNGKGARSPARPDPSRAEAASAGEDLEDLPF
jgi:single-strand DNA-binding protein